MCTFVFLAFAGYLSAETKIGSLIIKKTILEADEVQYRPRAIAFSPKGYLLIVSLLYRVGNVENREGKLLLTEVGLGGEKLKEIEVTSLKKDQDPPHVYQVFDLSILENGDVLLLALVRDITSVGRLSLIRIDQMGQVIFVSQLLPSKRTGADVALLRILHIDEHHSYLLGAQAKDALLVKVDDKGNTVWERKFDHEQRTDVFLDGFATDDGGAVLVAQSEVDGKEQSGEPVTLWLIRVGTDGEVKTKQTLLGRRAMIASTLEGGCAITYDLGQKNSQDAWLQVFDAELKPKWKTHLFSSDFGFTPLYITTTEDGGFVIATTKRGIRLWIAKVDQRGSQIGEYFEEHEPKQLSNSGFVVVKDTSFLLAELTRSSAKGQVTNKAEVIKITTN